MRNFAILENPETMLPPYKVLPVLLVVFIGFACVFALFDWMRVEQNERMEIQFRREASQLMQQVESRLKVDIVALNAIGSVLSVMPPYNDPEIQHVIYTIISKANNLSKLYWIPTGNSLSKKELNTLSVQFEYPESSTNNKEVLSERVLERIWDAVSNQSAQLALQDDSQAEKTHNWFLIQPVYFTPQHSLTKDKKLIGILLVAVDFSAMLRETMDESRQAQTTSKLVVDMEVRTYSNNGAIIPIIERTLSQKALTDRFQSRPQVSDTGNTYIRNITHALELLGRNIEFTFISSRRYIEEFRGTFFWFVPICGMVLVLLLAAYIFGIISRNRTIELAIDKRRVAEHKMRLFETAVVHAHDAVIISKPDFINDIIIYVNEAFTRMTGFAAEDVVGKPRQDFWNQKTPPQVMRRIDESLQNGQTSVGEVVYTCADGSTIWVQQSTVPVKNDAGEITHYTSNERNITERIEFEQQIIKEKTKAEDASRLKSDFLATMSHEIRTPMNGIIGMAGLLLDTELTQQQKGYVGTIMHSSDALLSLINDILDFSKIESGRMQIESIAFDLRSAAEDVLDLLVVRAREKNIELLLHYIPGTSNMVVGDPGRIRQILYNLVGNAIKFTPKGYVLVKIEPRFCSTIDPTVTFHISVEDTGIGIAKDKQAHIFDKFTQADSSTTRRFGGSGLGLAICKQLTTMMGGEIGLDSDTGKGSVFWFSLPLHVFHEKTDHVEPVSVNLNGIRILFVDDVPINHAIIQEQLKPAHVRFECCERGMAALQLMHKALEERDPYKIAIIDYRIPDINGEELARIIKGHPKLADTVLIMLTAVDDVQYMKTLANVGFADFLTKPVRQRTLIESLVTSLGNSQMLYTNKTVLQKRNLRLEQTEQPKPFEGIRVLLAEDNMVNQQVAMQMLGKLGCHVSAVANGQEAIDMLRDMSFDIILMDCQMPEMDGFEASHIIGTLIRNAQIKPTPIVAITANALAGDRERCLDAGMQDYIPKPINQKDLEQILNKWINQDEDYVTPPPSALGEPILDEKTFNALMRLMDNSGQTLIESYIHASTTYIAQIENSIHERNWQTLVAASHPLKSSSGALGLFGIRDLAALLEKIGRDADTASPDFSDLLAKAGDLVHMFETAKALLLQKIRDIKADC